MEASVRGIWVVCSLACAAGSSSAAVPAPTRFASWSIGACVRGLYKAKCSSDSSGSADSARSPEGGREGGWPWDRPSVREEGKPGKE